MIARESHAVRSVLGSRAWLWLGLGALSAAFAPASSRALVLVLFNLVLAALFVWDRARLGQADLAIQRRAPRQLKVRVATPYFLELALHRGPALRLVLEEPAAHDVDLSPGQHRLRLRTGQRARLAGEISMPRHGSVELHTLAVRSETQLGLCGLVTQHAVQNVLRAYPERSARRANASSRARRAQGQAAAATRAPEQGGEIESLREYVVTDSMRSIDWKASAKRRRPITRSYQPERNQTLWIVIDASRAMTLPSETRSPNSGMFGSRAEPRVSTFDSRAEPPASTLSSRSEPGVSTRTRASTRTRFEATLDAALALAEAALTQGDRVGFLVYGREQRLCLAPRAGRAHLLTLMEACLHVHAAPEALDTTGLLATLRQCAPKRSLLVLFTDLDNEGDLRALAQKAQILSRRHVSLCVSLRPEPLQKLLSQPVESEPEVYRKLAAISLHEQRSQLSRALSLAGLPVLESGPLELSESVVARYQEAKISGRI